MSALEKAIIHSKNIGIDECEVVVVKKNITTEKITDQEMVKIKQNFNKNIGEKLINKKKIKQKKKTIKKNK